MPDHLLKEHDPLLETGGPLGGAELIRRPRLEARLHDACAARVTRVHAPAGYGKSCLLLQWLQSLERNGVTAAYVALTPLLRDLSKFLSHLVDAIHAQTDLTLPAIRSFLADDSISSADLLAKRIGAKLGEAGRPVFLLLDNVHCLNGSAASAALRAIVACAPADLHIVLASRETLDIPLARLKAHGRMCEITAQDLRFLGAESAELLARSGAGDLTADECDILERRTEGWAVGLKLAALALTSNPDRTAILNGFSGERADIRDYFMQDVVAGWCDDLESFLLKTSILDRLCAPLCDAVTGRDDSRQMLDRCAQAGLFVFPTDDTRTWYRFHRLFRDFLVRAFSDRMPAQCAELHVRASAWFLDAGLHVDAFEHALKAKDPIRAAQILDTNLDAMFDAGQARTFHRLATEIPPYIQAFYPRIMLAAAWSKAWYWKFADVRHLLTGCRTRLADMQRLNAAPAADLAAIADLVRHREMMLAECEDDMAAVEAIGNKLIHACGNLHPVVAGSIQSAFLLGKREHYKLFEAERLDAAARNFLDRCESPRVLVAHDAVAGTTRLMMGDTDGALAALRGGLDIAVHLSGPGASIGATCALPLAELLFERNEFDAASELLDAYLPVATELGFVDQLICGWLTQSRLFRAKGDHEAALRMLGTAGAFAAHSGFDRLGLAVADERIRQLLRSGRPDEALRAARQAGIKPAAGAPIPSGKVTTRDETRASIRVSWLELHNRRADALALARHWRSFTAGAGARRNALRWDIRIAHLLHLDGELRSAKRTLLRAIELAEPCGFMRVFLDEPALLDALLPRTPQGKVDFSNKLDAFAARLRAALEGDAGHRTFHNYGADTEPAPLGGTLTKHELRVLRLAAGGLTSREIGDRLGMTEGSIKWHLQQIYDKLGVRRRLQAVERARHLGFIA
jgi:LuxR family maltose regulon positive regulatory protein